MPAAPSPLGQQGGYCPSPQQISIPPPQQRNFPGVSAPQPPRGSSFQGQLFQNAPGVQGLGNVTPFNQQSIPETQPGLQWNARNATFTLGPGNSGFQERPYQAQLPTQQSAPLPGLPKNASGNLPGIPYTSASQFQYSGGMPPSRGQPYQTTPLQQSPSNPLQHRAGGTPAQGTLSPSVNTTSKIFDELFRINQATYTSEIRQLIGDTETRIDRTSKYSENTLNILVLGSPSSRKSNFIFKALTSIPSSSAMFHFFTTAGHEDVFGVNDNNIRLCSGFVFVFSVVSRESFDCINKYLITVQAEKESDSLPFLLVMNDTNKPEDKWEVSLSEATQFAESIECPLVDLNKPTEFTEQLAQFHDTTKKFMSKDKKQETQKEIEVVVLGEEFVGKTTFIHNIMNGEFIEDYSGTGRKLTYRKLINDCQIKFVDTPGWVARPNNVEYSKTTNEYEKGDFEKSIEWLRENSLLNTPCFLFMFTGQSKSNLLIAKDFHNQINAARGLDAKQQLWINVGNKNELNIDINASTNLWQAARQLGEIFEQISVKAKQFGNLLTRILNFANSSGSVQGSGIGTTERSGFLLKGKSKKNCKSKHFVKIGTCNQGSCILVGKDRNTCTKQSCIITRTTHVEYLQDKTFCVSSLKGQKFFCAGSEDEAKIWVASLRSCCIADDFTEQLILEYVKELIWNTIVEHMGTDNFKGSDDIYAGLKESTFIAAATAIEHPAVSVSAPESQPPPAQMSMGGLDVGGKNATFRAPMHFGQFGFQKVSTQPQSAPAASASPLPSPAGQGTAPQLHFGQFLHVKEAQPGLSFSSPLSTGLSFATAQGTRTPGPPNATAPPPRHTPALGGFGGTPAAAVSTPTSQFLPQHQPLGQPGARPQSATQPPPQLQPQDYPQGAQQQTMTNPPQGLAQLTQQAPNAPRLQPPPSGQQLHCLSGPAQGPGTGAPQGRAPPTQSPPPGTRPPFSFGMRPANPPSQQFAQQQLHFGIQQQPDAQQTTGTLPPNFGAPGVTGRM